MQDNVQFPTFAYHHTKAPVTVSSQKEMDELGSEWSFRYRHQEYPRAVHHHELRQSKVVGSKAEHEVLGKEWVTTPLPAAAEEAPAEESSPIAHQAKLDEQQDQIDELKGSLARMEKLMLAQQSGAPPTPPAPAKPEKK